MLNKQEEVVEEVVEEEEGTLTWIGSPCCTMLHVSPVSTL